MADQLPIEFFVPANVLRSIGLRAISMIRERTLGGIDADGRPFRAYSTEPFARPLGGITQRARKALGEKLHVFKSRRSGKLWAVIEGGYAAYKAASYPGDQSVNLHATGAMLRALTIVGVDEGNATVTLGFTRTDEALKALYHDQIGVGTGRVMRRFLGFTTEEQVELARLAAGSITIRT